MAHGAGNAADGLNEAASTLPPRSRPVSPPFKRSLSASPQTDTRPCEKVADTTRQAVRVKLWDQEARPLSSINSTRLAALATAANLQDSTGVISIPGTPPEVPYEARADPALLAEAVGTALLDDSCDSPDALGLVADRQVADFEALEPALATLLARLCSQHWLSDYNSLKRSIAAGTIQAPFTGSAAASPSTPLQQQRGPGRLEPQGDPGPPPMPKPIPRAQADGQAHPSDLIFLKPSQASPRTEELPARHGEAARTGLTPRAAKVSLAPPILTANSTTAEGLTPSIRAAVAEQVLVDLDQGEPVSIGAVPISSPADTSSANPSPVALPETLFAPPATPSPPPGIFLANGMAVKTSLSHPINISPLIPPESVTVLADRIFDRNADVRPTQRLRSPSPQPGFVLSVSSGTDLYTLVTASTLTGTAPPLPSPSGASVALPRLGNFVLSSCPGKKVRMNGEAAKCGRGAICRDVHLDLQRARDEHNVRLVVCCLDDAELHFLGVPWSDYAAAADNLGLEVVRMPMLEGFAPASAETLDADLAHIVRDYTLKGFSVLAHCRGGIGRAGLVASCWMLKMGLVAIPPPSSSELTPLPVNPAHGYLDDDLAEPPAETLEVLVRVIELIRRRRNIKAIETPHQVHFLLQYITHLRDTAQSVSASELLVDAAAS